MRQQLVHGWPLIGLIFGVLILAGVVVIALSASGRLHTVYLDGETELIRGEFAGVGELLVAAGVDVEAHDLVYPPLTAPVSPDVAVLYRSAQEVSLRIDGEVSALSTSQQNIEALLQEHEISIRPSDLVIADGQVLQLAELAETPLPTILEVSRLRDVAIYQNGEVITLQTTAQTVGEALDEAGIIVFSSDSVEPEMGAWLRNAQQIHIDRSMPLTIQVDGRTIETRSRQTTPLGVLAELGIGLAGQDYTRPDLGSELHPGDTIHVIRVREELRFVEETLPYQTMWQPTDELELDERAVLVFPSPGVSRRAVLVRFENGVEVSTEDQGEWVETMPVNEVIGYGTQVAVRVLDTPEGPIEYWRVVRMRVTAYTAATAGKPRDHPAYGITASGVPAGKGVVAIDPAVVPFRSNVYVPGYGVGFAGDTGGGVKGRWIDLGYDEGEIEAWRGYVDVYYLTPAPAPDDINYLIPSVLP